MTYNQILDRAEAALKEVVPDISDEDAMREMIAAVHYASVHHPKWLYALYVPAPKK